MPDEATPQTQQPSIEDLEAKHQELTALISNNAEYNPTDNPDHRGAVAERDKIADQIRELRGQQEAAQAQARKKAQVGQYLDLLQAKFDEEWESVGKDSGFVVDWDNHIDDFKPLYDDATKDIRKNAAGDVLPEHLGLAMKRFAPKVLKYYQDKAAAEGKADKGEAKALANKPESAPPPEAIGDVRQNADAPKSKADEEVDKATNFGKNSIHLLAQAAAPQDARQTLEILSDRGKTAKFFQQAHDDEVAARAAAGLKNVTAAMPGDED